MTLVEEYEFATKALMMGGIAIVINTLPFMFLILKEIAAAKQDDKNNYDVFSAIGKIYFIQLFIVLTWFFTVKTLNIVDEGRQFLPLLGNDGLFHYFWYEDLSGVISRATNSGDDTTIFYSIQWVRMWFDLIVTLVTFFVLIWGVAVGYSQGKKVVEDDAVKLFGYAFFGFIVSFLLLNAYMLITQDSFFNEKTVADVISEFWYKMVIEGQSIFKRGGA